MSGFAGSVAAAVLRSGPGTALSSCLPAPAHRPHRCAQECWTDNRPDASGVVPHAGVDCSKEVINATLTWLKLGGRRIDNGDSYEDMHAIGEAMKASGVPRKEIFLVTKIGDGGLGLGEEDTKRQVDYYLEETMTTYVDLLLIHWPTSAKNSTDPVCQMVK